MSKEQIEYVTNVRHQFYLSEAERYFDFVSICIDKIRKKGTYTEEESEEIRRLAVEGLFHIDVFRRIKGERSEQI